MTDTELRALMNDSVQKAHRQLFDEYCNYVYAIVINVLRTCASREDMEECVSDIFAKLFKSIDGGFKGNLKGYIGTIAKRTSIDFYRKISGRSGLITSIDDETAEPVSSADDIVRDTENSDQCRTILQKIKELGEPDSTIIIHQYYYDRTSKEIGKKLGMTPAAVQKRSSRARQKLKTLLTEAGIGREAFS